MSERRSGIKMFRWMGWIAAIGAVVVALHCGVATSCYIPSEGMEDSLWPGDRILVNRWSYGWRTPLEGCLGYHRLHEQPGRRGEIALFNHPAQTQHSLISRRDLYIGRLLGLPGDTLYVDSLYAVQEPATWDPNLQTLYSYPAEDEAIMDSLLHRLQLSQNRLLWGDSIRHVRSFSSYERYLLEQEKSSRVVLTPVRCEGLHPLVVPSRGSLIQVTPWNITLLRNTLVIHEHRRAEIVRGELQVDGVPVSACRFTQDYYWVGTNNPVNLSDSRLFGFVPHSHLIGKATHIWFSKTPHTPWMKEIRWARIGRAVE